MTLENTLLEKLSEWRPPEGRQELTVSRADWQATVSAERCDVLGCLLAELTVRRQHPVQGGNVRAWAERIAERTTGLLEALKVLEIDELRQEGILRSNAPAQKGEKLFYYEVLLRGTNEATLRRYEGGHNAVHRKQVPFALTHEVVARVAQTLAGDK